MQTHLPSPAKEIDQIIWVLHRLKIYSYSSYRDTYYLMLQRIRLGLFPLPPIGRKDR